MIISFLLNAGLGLDGGIPTDFAWPIFAAGMAIVVIAAWVALRPPMLDGSETAASAGQFH